MANEIKALEIITAITQVMQGELGTVRRVPTGIYAAASFISFDRDPDKKKQVALAVLKAGARNAFELEITPVGDNGASPPPATSSERYINLAILIRVLKATSDKACMCDVAFGKPQDPRVLTTRIEAQAQLIVDLEKAVEALHFPSNVTATREGASTGIVDLLLGPTGEGVPTYATTRPIWEQQFIEAQITARAVVVIEQAT